MGQGIDAINELGSKLGDTDGKYLTFFTDGCSFGIPIANVEQIVGMQKITEVPEYPYYARGIITLRGAIIPVMDVRLRLGKPEADYTDRTCIIVIKVCERLFGLIVDEVDEVTYIDDEAVSPPPSMFGEVSGRYLTGVAQIENKISLLIDSGKLLGSDEFDTLAQVANV